MAIKTDAQLKRDVEEEFMFDPEVGPIASLVIEATSGKVTIHGVAPSQSAKWAAPRAAYRVMGVKRVDNDITVNPTTRSDYDVLSSLSAALRSDSAVPERIQVEVQDGSVTLSRSAAWHFERRAAEDDAWKIYGVQSVTNDIQLTQPTASASDVHSSIERALTRNAHMDANKVTVNVDEGHVTLSGTVRSWAEREEAEAAAWRAHGVHRLTNEIVIN